MAGTNAFWLIRHAPVAGPAGVIHAPDARADVPSGIQLQRLRDMMPPSADCYCSPTARTRETAAALGLSCTLEPLLREQDFGEWFGRRHDEMAAEQSAAYNRFWRTPAESVPPGGESFVEQIRRTRSAMDRMTAERTVLIIHSGTVRAILAIALSLEPERALSFVVDPLSLTRVDRTSGGWRICAVNSRV